MSKDRIQPNDSVERYVKGDMTPEEQVAFEEYFLDKPELLEQIELSMILDDKLPEANEQVHKAKAKRNKWQLLTVSFSSVVLAVIAFGLYLELPKDTVNQASQLTEVHYVAPMRSKEATTSAEIELLPDTKSVLIVFQPNVLDADSYRIRFKDQHNTTVLDLTSVKSQGGDLPVQFDARWLTDNTYRVEIIPEGQQDNSAVILLTVSRAQKRY